MKPIAFVTPWFGESIPGGAEMALRGIAKHLHESGLHLEILTTCVEQFSSNWNVDFYKPGTYNWDGIPVRRFPVRKRDTAAFDRVNAKLIQGLPITLDEEEIFMVEMVNSPELYTYISANQEAYALFAFIPYMFGTTYYGIKACLKKSLLIPCLHRESYAYFSKFKELFATVQGMIFLSEPEYQLAKEIYNLRNIKTEVIGTGIDTDIRGNAKRLRHKYDIQYPFILYAGRKDVGKNVDTLLHYFEIYKKRRLNDLKLVLIGGGSIEIPQSVSESIIDLGFVTTQDKYDACNAAMVLCQPSKNESFSLVIMESWLCMRPVLVHAQCDVTKNFAIQSQGGLYFNDYWEFEGCIDFLQKNPDKASHMGNCGRNYVMENFDWHVVVERYKKYFQQFL